jgi:hypothetical protein
MLNDLLASIAFLARFFREQYFQNALDFCLRGDVFSGNSTSKMRRRFFREQYFQNAAAYFVLFTLKLKDGMIKIKKIN